jgi:hypothetical protein
LSDLFSNIPLTYEHKRKISESTLGYIKSEKHCENLSKNNARWWQGKQLKQTHIDAAANSHRKSIIQYSKNMDIVAEWNSLKEAGELTGISKNSISSCCNKKLKAAGGFIWKFKNNQLNK